MAYTRAFSTTRPDGALVNASQIDDEIRIFREDVEERLSAWFEDIDIDPPVMKAQADIRTTATGKIRLDGSLSGDTYLYENAANNASLFVGGSIQFTVAAASAAFYGDLALTPTKKFYLDGGVDTYIVEGGANQLDVVVGGVASLRIQSTVISVGLNADLILPTTKKLYLDSGGDTYITESSANVISFFVGGAQAVSMSTTTFNWLLGGVQALSLGVNGAAGTLRDLNFASAGVGRWTIRAESTAESGSDAGSAFNLIARTDAGVLIDAPISIARPAGGTMTLSRPIVNTSTTAHLAQSATTASLVTGLGTGSGVSQLVVRAAAGQTAQMIFYTGASSIRWAFQRNATAESGSNAGSNFTLIAYSDTGVAIDTPISITRAVSGNIALSRSLSLVATNNFFLDGGGDTYIYEELANTLTFVVGGSARASMTASGVSVIGAVAISAGSKLNLDGAFLGDTYILESSANVMDFTVGGSLYLRLSSSGVKIPSGFQFYLDGGGDTYISENAANSMLFTVGASTYLVMTGAQVALGSSIDLVLVNTRKLYIDNGGDTYITESSANNARWVVGGITMLEMNSGQVTISAAGGSRWGIAMGDTGLATTLGFYDLAPIPRQILATGTGKTVDNVITALQNLGLVKQS